MILRDHDFKFSTLNADDIDRMEAAQKHHLAAAKAEKERYTRENVSLSGVLRSQCRLFMAYIDEVLGDGASQKLGLNGSDWGECQKLAEEFGAAIAAEKASMTASMNDAAAFLASHSAPQNRAQRRAQEKHKPRRSEGFTPALKFAATPAGFDPHAEYLIQRDELVEQKAARRAELLRELKALDDE